MSRIPIHYDERIPEADRAILESRRDVFVAATLTTDALYWTFVRDAKGRAFYQLRKYSDRSTCFVELTLGEIRDLPDDEIKAIIIQHERPCIDVEARLANWTRRLTALYDQLDSWLQGRAGWKSTRTEVLQREEDLMKQRGVRPRRVPVYEVQGNGRSVKFVPDCLWILGANGRVDVLTRKKTYMLIDLAADDAPRRDWQIVLEDPRRPLRPFGREAFLDLLESA